MNQPWIYMCSPSWSPFPLPSPSHPSGYSQCTSPEHLSHASSLGWRSVSHLIIYLKICIKCLLWLIGGFLTSVYISFLCLDKMTFVHPSFMCLNFISSFNLGSYVPLILYLSFHYVLCKFIHCIHLLNEAYLCVSILVLESLWNWTLEFMKTRKGNLTLIFLIL